MNRRGDSFVKEIIDFNRSSYNWSISIGRRWSTQTGLHWYIKIGMPWSMQSDFASALPFLWVCSNKFAILQCIPEP
jgi:hypothetical protein